MTHTSSCLTFNQRGSSLSLSQSLSAQLCHAHTMTAALIGFSLLRQRPTKAATTRTTTTNTKRHNENENCNFRQAAVARFHFTLLCPVFAGFSWLFSGYQLSSLFFFLFQLWLFFAIGARRARWLDCYFSVTKFTFHTFITFGSCN